MLGKDVRRELSVGLISAGLYFFALQSITSVLARYSRDLGISVADTSFIWSVVFLVSFLLRPFTGYLADRTSSFLAMSLGGFFMSAAAVTYMFSSELLGLLSGRLMQGVALGFFISPSIAAVASAAGADAGVFLGVRSMIVSLASIVTPPIAGALVDSVGYAPVFLMASSTALTLAFINLIEARRHKVMPHHSMADRWRGSVNKVILVLTGAALFNGVLYLSLTGLLQAHYRDLGYGAKVFGYFLMFLGLSSIISRYFSGRLSSHRNPLPIALLGHSITAASIFMLWQTYTPPLSYCVAAAYGFGMGLTVPSQQLMVASSVPSGVTNRALSVYAMGFDLGGFIGPLAYGYIASLHGYVAAYRYMILPPITAASLIILLLILKRKS